MKLYKIDHELEAPENHMLKIPKDSTFGIGVRTTLNDQNVSQIVTVNGQTIAPYGEADSDSYTPYMMENIVNDTTVNISNVWTRDIVCPVVTTDYKSGFSSYTNSNLQFFLRNEVVNFNATNHPLYYKDVNLTTSNFDAIFYNKRIVITNGVYDNNNSTIKLDFSNYYNKAWKDHYFYEVFNVIDPTYTYAEFEQDLLTPTTLFKGFMRGSTLELRLKFGSSPSNYITLYYLPDGKYYASGGSTFTRANFNNKLYSIGCNIHQTFTTFTDPTTTTLEEPMFDNMNCSFVVKDGQTLTASWNVQIVPVDSAVKEGFAEPTELPADLVTENQLYNALEPYVNWNSLQESVNYTISQGFNTAYVGTEYITTPNGTLYIDGTPYVKTQVTIDGVDYYMLGGAAGCS